MKPLINSSKILLMLGAGIAFIIVLSFSCKKDNDDSNNNNGATCWNENWLIGTWEGTTPSSVQPFANTKIRIVFDKVTLKVDDAMQGNPRKVWAYGGTLTWNVGGSDEWSMKFDPANYPTPDYNIIIYECVTITAASQCVENISLRVADTTQVDPSHSIDLDWMVSNSTSTSPATSIDLYGDVEIDSNGQISRADYPPDGAMIRLTKK